MHAETEARGLDLPPLYREVRLREAGDAFAHACLVAPEAGAGTLVWSRGGALLDVAVVLEPAMPLGRARLALYVGLSALADALAVHAPPEKPIAFAWPASAEPAACTTAAGASARSRRVAEPASAGAAAERPGRFMMSCALDGNRGRRGPC